MRDIWKEIQDNLDEIEKRYNVKILLAVESGSRAWGFASPDSDYDVRFIYMQDPVEYLRIRPGKDVIEWALDEVLDINGWDIRKALNAFADGNPNIMEWVDSPIVYRKAPEWEKAADTARQYFSEKAAVCHYYGMAKKAYQEHIFDRTLVRYKKYLYALRALLCCRWIERYHEASPVEFERLLDLFNEEKESLDRDLLASIRVLLEKKAVTEEKDLKPQVPVIKEFIRKEIERQKVLSSAAENDRKKDLAPLDKCFRDTLGIGM